MADERDAFYVVKKGPMIGVYKSLNDLQILLRSSVNGHAITVYKGYNLSAEAEEYLASHGLQNAMYSVDAPNVQEALFGRVIPCPFREPAPSTKEKTIKSPSPLPEKRLLLLQEVPESASFPVNAQQKPSKLDNFLKVPPVSSYCVSLIYETNQIIADLFASSLDLEGTHLKEGYDEGYADGLISGKEDGRQVGLKTGFEIGEELGFYGGCIEVWNSAIQVDSTCFSSRVVKSIKQMEGLLSKYPIYDPEDESSTEIRDSLRAKFKAICATLGVKLEYSGYPKATNAASIEF